MNKAAFLNIVRQVAPIQDQEVDDLEKLVVSFPYCQTAHVLLAKAAHDRGSMLSTQKLRRAAAHVSNRQLLKQLVYAPPVLEEVGSTHLLEEDPSQEVEEYASSVSEPFSEELDQNAATTEAVLLEEQSEVEEIALVIPAQEKEVAPEQVTADELPPAAEAVSIEEPEVFSGAILAPEDAATEEIAPAVLAESTEEIVPATEEAEAVPSLEPIVVVSEEVVAQVEDEAEEDLLLDIDLSEDDDSLDELLELIQISGLTSLSAPIPSVNLTHEEIISEITSVTEAGYDKEPVSVPFTRNQPQTEEADLNVYLEIAELDSLYDTTGYEFPMLKLPEATEASAEEENQDPYLAIFTQNNLAYWMGSSRLGESIQLKNELTSATPYYFQPELIIEHVKGKTAPTPAPEVPAANKLDLQLDIINQFLKSTPKRKTLANAQLNNEPQEDLSAKSSKIKKALVSENLALILVKQGKAKKAAKIYEQLIVKFPEKKSYFAEQIEKLRNE